MNEYNSENDTFFTFVSIYPTRYMFFAETIWNDVKRIKNIYKKRVKLVMFSFA